MVVHATWEIFVNVKISSLVKIKILIHIAPINPFVVVKSLSILKLATFLDLLVNAGSL
jgi:hypothetical protein